MKYDSIKETYNVITQCKIIMFYFTEINTVQKNIQHSSTVRPRH